MSDVGLYPDNDDLPWYGRVNEKHELSSSVAMFAFGAGIDRFTTSFGDIANWFTDISYGGDYRPISSTQMTSAMFRESLGSSDGLAIYDTILTLSYSIFGIAGIILLIVGNKIRD